MPDAVSAGISLLIGYLLGSLNTAIIVGKLYGRDIRVEGSRSAGLTNTIRILGRNAGLLVLAGDILKGVAACVIGLQFQIEFVSNGASDNIGMLAAGAGAVLGHNWPLYFGFRGGKGALTAAAVMLIIDWPMTSVCLVAFLVIVTLTRYVSLATILSSLCFVTLSFLPSFGHTIYFNSFAMVLAIIVIVKHKSNIIRLWRGTENKFSIAKNPH